jgi:hypothetical protein
MTRENQINLQMWIEKDFKEKLIDIAKKSGFIRWQSYVEALILLGISGDIQVNPPTVKKKDKVV